MTGSNFFKHYGRIAQPALLHMVIKRGVRGVEGRLAKYSSQIPAMVQSLVVVDHDHL
jgi:hypothetical protein